LLQGRSYADIAALLRLPDDDVRKRARTAAQQLVDSDAPPTPEVQAQVIDYLLGEQTVSEREQTRATLQDDVAVRKWAAQLVEGLSPLAKLELPAMPGPSASDPAAPTDEPTATPRVPAVSTDNVQPDTANAAASPTEPEPAQRLVLSPPPAAGRSPQRVRPRVRLRVAALAALVIVAVVVVIVAGSGGGPKKPTTPTGNVTQLVLTPTPAAPSAGGTVTVQQQNGHLEAEIRAHGLAPNAHGNSYGVWLYNTASDALLLGFVSPSVGPSRTFENGTALPGNASRFHFLIVTVETSGQPSKPGSIALRAGLRVP
jgi:anti-sigma-K factor RskA